ncbi:S-adenosyl-L-methionine-dependent methyltransferase [Podospora fimiseda]|uniref:S-adenosyl-L-methionine-dependent methyltransferase n=1 Tax=Podospora fimiseda TaxID=252190 RepID=A0AAN7BLY6_9PEZI|nr:S-adenosyl-L-methionine-dependent methyltransferase [Podospora fimiseda]
MRAASFTSSLITSRTGESRDGSPPTGGVAWSRETSPETGVDVGLSGQHWQRKALPEPEEDDELEDVRSLSSTMSLSSSIVEYRVLGGRTYHSNRSTDAEYWAPNDENQNDAQDIIHHTLTLLLEGKLYRAPLKTKKLRRVLDVGTGTGSWAIDFADENPEVEVIGTDLSPIQPDWVPPNVRFEMEDMTSDWTFKPNTFDYVHMRYLFGSIPDWDFIFEQAYRALKPGGWIETFDADAGLFSEDGSVAENSALDTWSKVFKAAGQKFGRTFYPVAENKQVAGLEKAGFKNLDVWDCNVPINGFMEDRRFKEIGQYGHLSITRDLEGMVLYSFQQIMGWKDIEIKAFTAHFKAQLRDVKNCHPVFKVRIVCAQKPEDAPLGE